MQWKAYKRLEIPILAFGRGMYEATTGHDMGVQAGKHALGVWFGGPNMVWGVVVVVGRIWGCRPWYHERGLGHFT